MRDREKEADSPWYVGEGEPLTYSQIRKYVGKVKRLILPSPAEVYAKNCYRERLPSATTSMQKAWPWATCVRHLRSLDSRDKLLRLFPTEERSTGAP